MAAGLGLEATGIDAAPAAIATPTLGKGAASVHGRSCGVIPAGQGQVSALADSCGSS